MLLPLRIFATRALLTLLLLIPASGLKAGQPIGISNHPARPLLRWKYSWLDGKLANTIGAPGAGMRLPTPSDVQLNGGYSPQQIRTAYGTASVIAAGGDGTGQTITIIDAYGSPTIQADLNVFCTQFNLPPTTVQIVYPYGKPGAVDSDWAGETTLDVEWAHAIAPKATIQLVIAPDNYSSLNQCIGYATGILGAKIVSMSFGAPEYSSGSESSLSDYAPYITNPSVSYFASAGDYGAQVLWPGADSNVVSVGGTSLFLNTNTYQITSEVGWSGSGGGISTLVPIPSYQAYTNVWSGRTVPDISYDADPYTGFYIYMTDPTTGLAGWNVFGGTSAGAPQWAALAACRKSLGKARLNLTPSLLYGSAVNGYSTYYRDITSGNNGYPAGKGYDLVTGLGSPVANQVAVMGPPAFSMTVGDAAGHLWFNAPPSWSRMNAPLTYSLGMARDSNNTLYVGDYGNDRILTFPTNAPYGIISLTSLVGTPGALLIDSTGNLLVSDTKSNAIVQLTTNGTILTNWTTSQITGLSAPVGLALDASGNVYVANNGGGNVIRIGTNGITNAIYSSPYLTKPVGVAIDPSGNLLVTSLAKNSVYRFFTNTVHTASLVAGSLPAPYGIAVDPSGNIYVACSGDNTVRKLTTTTNGITNSIYATTTNPPGLISPVSLLISTNQ
jgi:sugar lactone lactonase YvrE